MIEDRTDIEIKNLEELFAEESKCEMKHAKTACSSEVTHIAIDCRRQFMICDTAFKIISKMIEQNAACIHCTEPASKCWRLVAV